MTIKLQITPTNISSFKSALTAASQRIIIGANTGLDNAIDRVYTVAQNRVPRVTGALASSARTTNQNSGMLLQRTMGYGDSTTNPRTGKSTATYAVQVHEVFQPAHPSSYKWLELTIREYGQDAFLQEVASAIRASL